MRSDLLPLGRSTIERDGAAREDAGLLARLWSDRRTAVVLVHRGLVAVTASRDALDLARPADLPRPSLLVGQVDAPADPASGPFDVAYLGHDDVGGAYLVLVLSESAGEERDFAGLPADADDALVVGRTWATLRDVGAALADRDAGLASAAVALAAWHARHRRCPRCGEATEPVLSGWARRCPADGTLHHPRTDPAVIVAVTDEDDRLLLAHAAHWPARRFSLVAGYVEPGETIEAAVRREVGEECGIAVTDLVYQGSQPWPFPASLMLAFRARTRARVPVADGVEVTEATFVTRDALAADVAAGRVLLPMRASIARVLIEEWFGAPLPGA